MSATLQKAAVFVNDRPHPLAGPTSLQDLLGGMGLAEKRGVAVAVNGQVVARSAWAARALAPDDRVLLIRATQGG
jgi:sulfur carrier protein